MPTSLSMPTPTSSTVLSPFLRYQQEISLALRQAVAKASEAALVADASAFRSYYGQMHYHLGWANAHFSPVQSHPGKLLRPTLLLLAYELAVAQGYANECISHDLRRALPAAAAIELMHNFTLIHDDIEDGDTERRHRATLWKLWGVPQAINTGDGMIFVAHLALWDVLSEGVENTLATRLAQVLDRALLMVTEGQYLDLTFENVEHISVAQYVDMIGRKTAALMSCAAEMGALLGSPNEAIIDSLRRFGWALGIAFQIRDDILGVWGSIQELGKTAAGDIYRRKKSLPILHALQTANQEDLSVLHEIYQQENPVTLYQVGQVLTVFERTKTWTYCREFLAQQCQQARSTLADVPHTNSSATRAYMDVEMLIRFLEETA
ncbi:MAG: polyprenyl synthetase family protein [Chloroflexi bacterium]|nr:polyprenyl synthetase family protein [Chloroflexota bacterium]